MVKITIRTTATSWSEGTILSSQTPLRSRTPVTDAGHGRRSRTTDTCIKHVDCVTAQRRNSVTSAVKH